MDENLKACSVAGNFRIQRSGHFTELWFGNSRAKMLVKMIQIDNTSKFHFSPSTSFRWSCDKSFFRGFIFFFWSEAGFRPCISDLPNLNNKLVDCNSSQSRNSCRLDTGLFLENESTGWIFWKCWLEIEIVFIIFKGMRLHPIHIQCYLLWNEQAIGDRYAP